MSRDLRVIVGGINITLHPHSKSLYRSLIRDLFDLRQPVSVSGETHMIIASLDAREDSDTSLSGTIARFLKFDIAQPWFNEHRLDRADDADVKNIHIPEGLRPHYVPFFYQFDVKNHTLVYEQRYSTLNVNPQSVFRLFEKLCSSHRIVKKYGTVSVQEISDQEEIEGMLTVARLRQLRILVDRPNPDDFGDFDAEMEERLKKMNAESVEVVLKADKQIGLKPDKGTRALAHLAARNGIVETIGYSKDGNRFVSSTKNHPLLVTHNFHSGDGLGLSDFLSAVSRFLRKMKKS